jgi:exodeoxyribonuclease VII small subunit
MEMKLTFEEAMKQLEALVKELEQGNLALDLSLSKYTDGVKLAKYCHDLLQNAETMIVKLEQEGKWVDFPKLDE